VYGLFDPGDGSVEVVDPASDPGLPSLGRLLRTGKLVAYRPTRRAVVRLPGDGAHPHRYAKVLRAGRVAPLVARHELLETVRHRAGPEFPAFPPLLEWSDEEGVVTVGGVAGRSLHTVLRSARTEAAGPVIAVARALASLHGVPLSGAVPAAGGGRPLARWTARIGPFVDAATQARYESALAALPPVPTWTAAPRLVHGDLHDGNVVLAESGVAIVDLDSVGTGHPATDVGNLAAHLVLRGLQAAGDPAPGRRLASLLVQEYAGAGGAAGERAISVAVARSLFRLACVYVVRPRWRSVCPVLLAESARSNLGSSG
jgi:hypothetical protein